MQVNQLWILLLYYLFAHTLLGAECNTGIIMDNACYTINTTSQTWNAAQQTCNYDNRGLALINSAEVQSTIQEEMQRKGVTQLWIGAKQQTSQDPLPWRWIESKF